ncbi:MAG TPA: hypothetical protein VKQ71_06040, partial [Acidimicrobiales bacterium]|nr:hypothetical protein [Acidimicrobiales bacterium]
VAEPRRLSQALEAAVGAEGRDRAIAARAMFAGDAALDVAGEAAGAAGVVDRIGPRAAIPGRPRQLIQRAVAATAASVAVLYGVASFGVGTAAAHGVAVARAPHHVAASYVGVRLNDAELVDTRVQAALAAEGVTAIVNGRIAVEFPAAVAGLRAAGVDVANGGWGGPWDFRWERARADLVRSAHAIEAATNERVRLFVPARPVDAFDLASARLSNERIVVANDDNDSPAGPPPLRPGSICVIDGRHLQPDGLLALLAGLPPAAAAAGDLEILPLTALS